MIYAPPLQISILEHHYQSHHVQNICQTQGLRTKSILLFLVMCPSHPVLQLCYGTPFRHLCYHSPQSLVHAEAFCVCKAVFAYTGR